MEEITLRQADTNDIELIRAIAQIAFPATYRHILTPEQIEYMMDWMYSATSIRRQMEEGHVYNLAYIRNNPVGYVSIQKESEQSREATTDCDKHAEEKDQEALYHLHKIYVLPEYQGLGIGKTLFDRAIEHVRTIENVPSRIELNVNRHNKALNFYLHQGMTIARQGDFPIGNGFYMNDYILTLPIIP